MTSDDATLEATPTIESGHPAIRARGEDLGDGQARLETAPRSGRFSLPGRETSTIIGLETTTDTKGVLMRPAIAFLLCAFLVTLACEKKEEPPPGKANDKAAPAEGASATATDQAGQPVSGDEKKKAIRAEMTCPPGTKVRHSAWKDHGSKWCVRPDGKQHGMTVKTYTNPRAKWPFEMTGNWKEGQRDGTWTWWHDDGTKKKEGRFENGKKTGPWREWHKNGNQAVESGYRDGKLHGVWKRWALGGRLVEEGRYDQGKVVGSWTFWSRGGEELGKNQLGEAGTGPWKRWSAGGALLEEGAYLDGLRDGDWVIYFGRKDKKKAEGKYQQGKKVGKWIEYRGLMDRYQEGRYQDGQRTGKWVGWGSMPVAGQAGKKKKVKTWVEHYQNGRRHGKSLHFSHGKRQRQDHYVNGVREGKHISWDSDGKTIWRKGRFKAGKPCGRWTCYYRGRRTKCQPNRRNLPSCK